MKKRVISLLLALALCLTLLPAMALADDGSAPVGAVARIGANTYASLAAAVKAAAAGAKIELTDDDASEQRITIDKNLSIELNGHNLPKTCFTITHGTVSIRNSAADGGEINKDSEIVANKVSDSAATSYSLINDIRATISVFGDAQVTLHNLNVGSSGAVSETNPKLKPVYIGGSGAKLTINGGSYVGKKTEGTDGIFFYNGGGSELTINAGYFEGNCGLSVYPKPDTNTLHIVNGHFVGKVSALWIDVEGWKAVTTKETAEKFIDKSISQIVIDGAFNSKDITISSKLFLAVGSTGTADAGNPDQITLSGESVTLAPEILGGAGTRTYEWKNANGENKGSDAALDVTEAGSYTLTVTADGNDTLTVYYTVTASEHAHPICGEECAHHGAHSEEISDWVGVASLSEITKAGHYYLTANVDLSKRWVAVDGVVLCLNGKTITQNENLDEVIYIGQNTSLAITDCQTGDAMGKITHKKNTAGQGVVNEGSFTLYGGNITGNSRIDSGAGVNNDGTFTMYGGAITNNKAKDSYSGGGVFVNGGTFTMSGGEISGNTTENKGSGGGVFVNRGTFTMSGGTITNNTADNTVGGVGLNTYTNTQLILSGDARITGNTGSNVYLDQSQRITIGEGGFGENAKIGVTLRDWPAAGTTTEVANPATDGDQEHIISDNDRYEVSYDDGKLVVGVKVEKHEHFLCTTGESCTGVGGHEETEKVTFVKWTDELVKAQYNNSETRTAKNSLPKEAGYYYLDENVSLNSSWVAADGVVLCLNGHSVTQEDSVNFLFEVGSYGKSVAITVTDCKDSGTIGYPDSRPKMEKDVGVIIGGDGTFNLYGGTIQSCSVGVKIYKDGDKQGTFNMYGGKITGNTYGGVRIEGTFNMYAGAITGNTFLNSSYKFGNDILEGYAGGVYNSDGTFNMYGGSITNNTASGNTGGGVCVFGSVTTISGNATITGNKIYIDENTLIDCNVRTASPIAEITDGFTGSIGVTAYVWPEAGKESKVVSKANSATGVTSDRDDYEVLCKDGKLYVVKKDSQTEKKEQTDLTLKNIPSTGAELPYGEELDFVIEGGDGTGNVSWEVVNGEDGGKARIENGKLIPENTGTVTIKVRKEGDDTFKPTEITVTITIVKGKLTGAPSYTPITADGKTLKDAALEPNASWPKGTLTWVDAEGNVLDETTVVEANATYKWKFTPENENYESLTGSYTLYEKSGGDDDGPHKPSYPVINPTRPSTSNGSQTTSEPECPFRDVSKSDYSYKAITWAAENGIAGGIGNGLFDPNGPCTRAQIVTFLWRAAGSPAPKALSGFVDVPADAYYAKAVAWAVENGITKGTSATTFSPDDICTRAQAVTFLFRAFKAKANGVSTVFRDVAPTAYYAGAVKWAVDNEVTDGIGNGLFGPDNACTRAQIVTFLWRLYAD